MPNIHAINANGTEYGIEAENGITQEQVAKIATIGDVANLATNNKTTLVAAVNEVFTPTRETAPTYTLDGDTTVGDITIYEPTVIGKIMFASISITNVAGANIGGTLTQDFMRTSLRLSHSVSVYAQDYTTGQMARFIFNANGTVQIGESKGIQSGSNEIRLTAILPLA